MLKAFEYIEELKPDVSIFPEMCFLPSLESEYARLSKGYRRLIVAGSYYSPGDINTTVVFQDGVRRNIKKLFPSPHEPMFGATSIPYSPTEMIASWENDYKLYGVGDLDYFFKLPNGDTAVILNCLDYYKLGYYVARSLILSKDLSLLISPCSNNNVKLFIEESQAIHNHNSNIYSLIVNVDASLNEESYAIGESYAFGWIDYATAQIHKDLKWKKNHSASIVHAEKGGTMIYLEVEEEISAFKRSDGYCKNPRVVKMEPL